MSTDKVVSNGMFALLVVQARLKTAMSQNKDINPEIIRDEIDEAILYLDDVEKGRVKA